jgi:hypothetical protein
VRLASPARRALIDVSALVVAKALIAAWLVHRGFTHVSDDDYSRVVIAQLFAHAPKLDPSGTSWLPFPFWVTGAAMMALGRSIAVARGVAILLGALSVAPVYAALRGAGVTRAASVAGVAIAMTMPWSAWLAAAAVPEGFAGALVATGAIALSPRGPRVLGAAALFAASLSRYEAWPVCAVFAVACAYEAVFRASGSERRRLAFAAALAALGPLSWMAWNAHAHGSATHFLTRVSTYRQSIGAADLPLADKLLDYPRAITAYAPYALALAAIALASLAQREMLRRWWLPLTATLALFAFLVAGDVRDGAPTHHPERALVPVAFVLAAFGADGARALAARFAWGRPKREMLVAGAMVAGGIAFTCDAVIAWDDAPGQSTSESRAAQIARGEDLRRRNVAGFDVTPCGYEHFALLAAYGAPERVTIAPLDHRAVNDTCPSIVEH